LLSKNSLGNPQSRVEIRFRIRCIGQNRQFPGYQGRGSKSFQL
jgi:hypothetical protein